MPGKYLFDTNIVIALLNSEESVIRKINNFSEFFIPSIVLGELYFGAEKSTKQVENRQKILLFENIVNVLHCDSSTAQHYGKIKLALLKKGKPIPENDVWIAAIAIQHELILVSRDVHFSFIDGLQCESWIG